MAVTEHESSHDMTIQYRIDGMDCPDCAAKIEMVVAELPGVAEARVDFAGETLTARLDSPETAARVRDAVRSLGYGLAEGGRRVTSVLVIAGMDCAEEKALVEKALKDLSGLERFEVNLMSERLTVVHDAHRLPLPRLIAALDGVGLKATPFGTPKQAGGFWQRHARLVSTLVAGVLTAIGLMLHFLGAADVLEKTIYALALLSGG